MSSVIIPIRRRSFVIAATILAAVLLAGCEGDDGSPPAEPVSHWGEPTFLSGFVLRAVCGTGPADLVVAGRTGVLDAWDGEAWTSIGPDRFWEVDVLDVARAPDGRLLAVDAFGGLGVRVGATWSFPELSSAAVAVDVAPDGEIWLAAARGQAMSAATGWAAEATGEDEALRDICAFGAGATAVVGGHGCCCLRNAAGAWSNAPLPTTRPVNAVWGRGAGDFYAADQDGLIWRRSAGEWSVLADLGARSLQVADGWADGRCAFGGSQGLVALVDGATVTEISPTGIAGNVFGLEAVGEGGLLAATDRGEVWWWDGSVWEHVGTARPTIGEAALIRAETHAVAPGPDRVYMVDYVEHAGVGWRFLPFEWRADYRAICAVADLEATAVGADGSVVTLSFSEAVGGVCGHLRNIDGAVLRDVARLRHRWAVAVGEQGYAAEVNEDVGIVPLATGTTADLNAAWADTATGAAWLVGEVGVIVHRTADGGCTIEPSGTIADLRGVNGVSMSEVYAVGAGATLLRRDADGWTSIGAPDAGDLSEVACTARGDLVVAGAGGACWWRSDASWEPISLPADVDVVDLQPRADGGLLILTSDGTLRWWQGWASR